MKLEIGGGSIPREGYENLDINPAHATRPEFARRVQDGIPLLDNTVETVFASHVLEHIPSGPERINTFNEVFRVLEPGGTFEIVIPLVGHTNKEGFGSLVNGWWAFSDPTHVSYWWMPESFMYFCEGPFKPNADYGISIWQPLAAGDWEVRGGWEGRVTLRKPV